MTYDEVMAAARRADAAGEASDARRLLEIASLLPDRPQRGAGQTAPAPGQTPMPPATPQSAPGMVEAELFGGTIQEVPRGTDPALINSAARQETQTLRQPSPGIRVEPSRAAFAQGQAAGPRDKDAPPAPVTSGPWDKYAAQSEPQPAPQAASGFIEVEIPDGRILEFPAGTSQDVMRGAIQELLAKEGPAEPAPVDAATGQPLPMPITPPAYFDGSVSPGAPAGQAMQEVDDPVNHWLLDVGASAAKGVREGFTAIPDAAVHLVDQAPRLLNLPKMIPGMKDAYEDVGSVTEGGQALMNWALGEGEFAVPQGADSRPRTLRDFTGGFGTLNYTPQTGAGRFAERVGTEIGASALPAGAALSAGRFVAPAGGSSRAHEGVRQMVEPFVRNPGKATARELSGATAAGAGAATANAAHDAATGGEGGSWWSDLLGGIGGLGIAGAAEGVAGAVGNIGRHVTNSPKHRDMIAGETVADRLVDNSTTMQSERFAGRPLDAEVLARRLDQPTKLEGLVPEYRAGTADRSRDSGIRSLAYNTEALAPGAANTRREQNMSSVGEYIRNLQPDGNAPAFLETVRDAAGNIVDTARGAAGAARSHFDEAADAIRPRTQPIDRGQAIRDDMTSVYDQRRSEYRQAYDERDAAMAGDRIDARAPYQALQGEARRMTTYERDAYVPGDVMDSARKLAPGEAQAAQPSGLVDMFGQPMMRDAPAASAEIPLTEALSLRQGLTTKQREAQAAGRAPEHRALTQLSGALRQRIDDAMSPETRALDERARGLRRSVAADFEDGNLPSRILDDTGHGRSKLATETIAPRVTASETPYRDTMRHVGTREGARGAVRDQILADAQNAGALRNQDALNSFLSSRAYQFDDFPDARAALEAAGISKTQLDRAEAFVKAQERRYAPGSNSPVGRFTRHDDTGVADAMRGLWKSPRPREAVREVLETAGRTPQNLKNARAAFFEDMARTTTNTAHDAAGNIVWNGRMLDGFLKNPKAKAVMDELWQGNEGHLKNLREIGEALIDSESSLRARPAASSGTASISLQGKVDPALTATSVSSTLRSVQRNQMSVPIAGIHLLSGWVRGRSAKVHAAAINELMTKAMDDPKLAAELLRKHNPYDAQVMGRRFLRKFGLRVPQLANIVNEELGGYSQQDQAFDEFVDH